MENGELVSEIVCHRGNDVCYIEKSFLNTNNPYCKRTIFMERI